MILTRVVDAVRGTQGHRRVDEVLVMSDEVYPFLVLGHGNGSIPELLDDAVRVVSLAFEDAGVGVVSLLDFTDDNGFQLTAGALEV